MKILSRLRLLFKRQKTNFPSFLSATGKSQKRKNAIQQFDSTRQIDSETEFRNEFADAIIPLFEEDFEPTARLFVEFWHNIEGYSREEIQGLGFKEMISELLYGTDYSRLMKFVDYLLRDKRVPEAVIERIIVIFQKGYSPHHVIKTGNITKIVISSSPEDAYAQEQNLKDLYGRKVSNASDYLYRALEHLEGGRYLESIKESINALENSVCSLDQNSNNKTLAQSLMSLEKENIFDNTDLLSGIRELWKFANDTPGIRHGNKDPNKFVATEEQALLIYSLTTAWCAFLDKHNI